MLTELLAQLPPEPDETHFLAEIQRMVAESKRKFIVIDDDPTGPQTLHDIELLLTWDRDRLVAALRGESPLIYILTNSRSLSQAEAVQLNRDLALQLVDASRITGVDFVVASRSDSTLRGHYPAEVLALAETLRAPGEQSLPAHLLIPAFFEGGRYTIGNTHYVAGSGDAADILQPAHETPFARDSVFGYTTSYLPAWVEEKSNGHWRADQVASIELAQIRQGGPEAVAAMLETLTANTPVVVNAASYGDLAIVVLGLLRAEAAGKRFLYRTAASFVRLRGAVTPQPLLTTDQIMRGTPMTQAGGLVVVGSYVPGSSAQLENLLAQDGVVGIELPVERILQAAADVDTIYRDLSRQLDEAIVAGHTGILYTSRKLITGTSDDESLAIGKKVSAALIAIVHGIAERPRFIIAKGGITSHIIAQHGFGATSARVLGQILPGVSVWTLESGTRFQGIPYVVFPGNVGNAESLGQAVQTLNA
ncbi:MAG TPA: four-carbon acid sugar kinase family protein [Ktedonobacteraceae bacterium]|jgi:uncharacterized protein YgbK (DUF1537 family)|nr:four-carbon acid sugar kinase family protein [Ktedonobacteraceae bacterium]